MSASMKAASSPKVIQQGAPEPIAFRAVTPRLADSGLAGRTSSISPIVVRGCVRLADFAVVTLLGLAIAALYIDDTYVTSNPRYLAAIFMTGIVTVGVFELLRLYELRTFSSFVKKTPRVILMRSVVIS